MTHSQRFSGFPLVPGEDRVRMGDFSEGPGEAPSPPGTVTGLQGSEGRDQDTASTRTRSRNSAIVLCDIQVEVLPGQHTHSPL